MTNYLWFVLAGFLLGFVASTLWEWYHFRKERLKLTDRRIRELEDQVRELEAANLQPREDAEWSPRTYRSPGVFLESEEYAAAPASAAPAPYLAPAMTQPEADAKPARPARSEAVPAATRNAPRTAAARSRQELLETLRRNSEVMQRGQAPRAEPAALQSPAPTVKPAVFAADGEAVAEEPKSARAVAANHADNGISAHHTAAQKTSPAAPPLSAAEVDPIRQRWLNDPELTRRSQEFPDDLSKIKGIGDVYKQRLYRAGICTWRQIAEGDFEALRKATGAYPSSNVEEWPVQARKLMEKHNRSEAAYRGPTPDDLTKILGIGPVSASTLYRTGICTYEQLATTAEAELAALFPIAVAGDQPDFAAWIERAAALADAKHKG